MSEPVRYPCKRCGIGTGADYCRDCRSVAPDFCRDGRGAVQLRHERAAARAQARVERLMLYRMIGYNVESGHF